MALQFLELLRESLCREHGHGECSEACEL
jgi:hypothetical protein